jgi:long-chain acyl-CoA synthetase
MSALGTLCDHLASTAAKWGDRTALLYGDTRYTYAELDARANQVARLLASLGVRKGDGVGLLLHNTPEFAVGFVACQKLGAVSSCLNYRLAAASVAFAVDQEKLRVLLFDAEFEAAAAEVMRASPDCRLVCVGDRVTEGAVAMTESNRFPRSAPPAVEMRSDEVCNVIHTSGTTGRPKGAAFTHETQILTAIQYCLEMGLDRGHVGMSLAPVVIGAATNFFVAYLFIGGTNVMTGEYDAKRALRLVAQHRVTEIFAVPTQMHQLSDAIGELGHLDISSLRLLRSGGSPLPKTLLQRVRSRLGCEVLNTYGTTESCTAITTCHTGFEPEEKWESIGKPSYFQAVRVIPYGEGADADPDAVLSGPGEGQLINRGPQSISQYYCTPSERLRARRGWQYARDVVRLDSDGYIFPVDRIDNVLISGGENIYPQEIEFFLSKHPLVADVAVCGAADEKWGQVVKALIVRRSPLLTAQEIDRYCLESAELSRHKRPRVVEFVDTLPRNVLGKIDRTALR